MTGVTLTKPAQWAVPANGAGSAQPTWWTGCVLCEPVWHETVGVGGGGTVALDDEITGAGLAVIDNTSPIEWSYDSSATGVGLALKLATISSGAECLSSSAAAFNGNTASGLVIFKLLSGTKTALMSISTGVRGYGVTINAAGKIELFSNWAGIVWTGTLNTVPSGEWHILAWSFDATAGSFLCVLDGIDANAEGPTSGLANYAGTNQQYADYYLNADSAVGAAEIAFLVRWNLVLADADLALRSNPATDGGYGPYDMIKEASVVPAGDQSLSTLGVGA